MGRCQSDPQVAVFCNDAQERLLMDPMAPDEGWYGGSVTLASTLSVTNGAAYVVLPREIARLIVTGVCQEPVRIRNGFYEYLKFGAGLQPKTCQGLGCSSPFEAYQRDSVPTLTDLVGTKTVRIYPTDTRDTGLRVLVQGADANGMTILTTNPVTGLSAPGEYVSLAFPFADTTNTFSTITGIQKDQTYGPVQFFQVDTTTGVELPLSAMEPTEAASLYRKYLVNGVPSINLCCPSGSTQLMGQGRLDFIPVANETDYLTIQCVPALIEESISIRYSRMDSGSAGQKSQYHHARALALLNGQLDVFEGKISTAVRMPLFGSNPMRSQLV
jgi:hypothetical protein